MQIDAALRAAGSGSGSGSTVGSITPNSDSVRIELHREASVIATASVQTFPSTTVRATIRLKVPRNLRPGPLTVVAVGPSGSQRLGTVEVLPR